MEIVPGLCTEKTRQHIREKRYRNPKRGEERCHCKEVGVCKSVAEGLWLVAGMIRGSGLDMVGQQLSRTNRESLAWIRSGCLMFVNVLRSRT